MNQKRTRRTNRTTRPFMPIHGRKGVHRDKTQKEEKVMEVGAEALFDDDNPSDAGMNGFAGGLRGTGTDLEKVQAERDSYLELARRGRADFDNYRKRVERDMQQMKRESLADFLRDFFAPLDDMDRVLVESQKNQSFESLATGVRIMEENFRRALTKAGVRKIDAKDKPFDPALHEAMLTVPSADVAPNTVLEVYENGYVLDGFVLRPARVVVSRAPDA